MLRELSLPKLRKCLLTLRFFYLKKLVLKKSQHKSKFLKSILNALFYYLSCQIARIGCQIATLGCQITTLGFQIAILGCKMTILGCKTTIKG